jgi:DNA-binding response OmpR family regulator
VSLNAQLPAAILVVEDDPSTRELIAVVLRRAGHTVEGAADAAAGFEAFCRQRPDLVLLDVGLPGEDGIHLLGRLREVSECPIVMLSGVGEEIAKVRALMRGADDYLVKPASAPELLARVAAVLRRARRDPAATGAEVYDDGRLKVDLMGRAATAGGKPIALTPLEYKLLSAFVRHPGEILSRGRLLELVWGDAPGSPDDHVKLAVGYLRRKLSAVVDGEPIETVRGFGYRWTRSAATADALSA